MSEEAESNAMRSSCCFIAILTIPLLSVSAILRTPEGDGGASAAAAGQRCEAACGCLRGAMASCGSPVHPQDAVDFTSRSASHCCDNCIDAPGNSSPAIPTPSKTLTRQFLMSDCQGVPAALNRSVSAGLLPLAWQSLPPPNAVALSTVVIRV